MTSSIDPWPSALDLAAAIRRREVSPTEAMTEFLTRVDARDPQLNAFALRDDERAMADAVAATQAMVGADAEALPRFHGVPLPIKDLDDVGGWPTSLGSNAASVRPRAHDSELVARFRRAGFVFMGKTTTPEFGTVSYTESDRLGVTRNPWNTAHTPGGSSGGAAAAVSSGMAPIAHGSDGGGSIRIPASCCGLVGLKPSRNRITDSLETFHGGSTGGVLARTVADSAAALDELAVFDPGAFNVAPPPERPFLSEVGRDPGRLRIAVTTTSPVGLEAEAEPGAAVAEAVRLLEAAGHEVVGAQVEWPDVGEFIEAFMTLWGTGPAYYDLEDPSKVEPHDRAADPPPTADDYVHALNAIQRATRAVAVQFGAGFDLLLTPTMCVEPPPVGTWLEGVGDDPAVAIMNCLPMAAFTAVFNATGLPAISLPVHVAASGLPVGVQLVGGPWQDSVLYRVAAQLEAECRWFDRHPG